MNFLCVKWSVSIWIYIHVLFVLLSFILFFAYLYGAIFHLPKNFLCGSSGNGFSQGFFFPPENTFIPFTFLKGTFTEFKILDCQMFFSPLMISFHGGSVISVERVFSIIVAPLRAMCLYSWDCF